MVNLTRTLHLESWLQALISQGLIHKPSRPQAAQDLRDDDGRCDSTVFTENSAS